MPAQVTPLDPDSDKGREVTERLSATLARIRVAIAARKAATTCSQSDPADPQRTAA
jgi:hypothetical protein